jgi:hypothetical protein
MTLMPGATVARALLQGLRLPELWVVWGIVQVMAAYVHTSPAVATPFPLSLLLWLHTPLPILFQVLYWLGICVAYGGSRGADRKQKPCPDTSTDRDTTRAGPLLGPLEGTELGFTALPWAPLGWRQLQTYQDVFCSLWI